MTTPSSIPEHEEDAPLPLARSRTIAAGLILFVGFLFFCTFISFPSPSVHAFAVPYIRSSLLAEGGVSTLLAVTVGILPAAVLALLLVTSRRPMSVGLALGLGLLGLSHRTAGVDSLLSSTGGNPFLLLLIELAVLALPIVAVLAVIETALAREADEATDWQEIGMSILATAAISGLLIYFLLPTSSRFQVLGGLFVAGFLGSAITRSTLAPYAPGWSNLVGLIVVGLAAYAYHAFAINGVVFRTQVMPWARALPLDYLSAGLAGCMLGVSVGLRGLLESEEPAAA